MAAAARVKEVSPRCQDLRSTAASGHLGPTMSATRSAAPLSQSHLMCFQPLPPTSVHRTFQGVGAERGPVLGCSCVQGTASLLQFDHAMLNDEDALGVPQHVPQSELRAPSQRCQAFPLGNDWTGEGADPRTST